jgi:hypothetical protein
VKSYADLAALNPEEIASLLTDAIAVRPERIGDEDWTGQAAKLVEEAAVAGQAVAGAGRAEGGTAEGGRAEGGTAGAGRAEGGTAAREAGEVVTPTAQGAPASSPGASAANDATGLHYQSFLVRVLLHESDGRIASTTIQHVGSGTERRWPGLDKPALLDFISAYLSPGPAAPLPARPPDGPGESRRPEVPAPSPPGEVSLTLARDLRVPRSDEPFTVSITLDLTNVEPPAESRVRFSAVVLARPLSGAAPRVVAEGKGIVSADAPLITLHSAGLPAATYRLEAVVELIEPHGRSRDLVASMEGGILVVSGRGTQPSGARQLQRIR